MAQLAWPQITELLKQGYSLDQLKPLVSGTQYNQLYFLNRYGPGAFGLWAGPFKPQQGMYRGEALSPEIQKAISDYMSFYDQQGGTGGALGAYMQQNPNLGLRDWQKWAGGKGSMPGGGGGGGGGSPFGAGGGGSLYGGGYTPSSSGMGPLGTGPGNSAFSYLSNMPILDQDYLSQWGPSLINSGQIPPELSQLLSQASLQNYVDILSNSFAYNRGLEQYTNVGRPLQDTLLSMWGDVLGQEYTPQSNQFGGIGGNGLFWNAPGGGGGGGGGSANWWTAPGGDEQFWTAVRGGGGGGGGGGPQGPNSPGPQIPDGPQGPFPYFGPGGGGFAEGEPIPGGLQLPGEIMGWPSGQSKQGPGPSAPIGPQASLNAPQANTPGGGGGGGGLYSNLSTAPMQSQTPMFARAANIAGGGPGSFNPGDARTWGQFLAAPAQMISRQTQAGLEQLKRTLGPNSGAYRQAASRLVNQGYGDIAGTRQKLAMAAPDALSGMMSQSLGYNPAGPMGAGGSAMGALTTVRGQDLQNSQFGQSLNLQQQALNAQRGSGLASGLGGLLGGLLGGATPWWMSDPRVKESIRPHKGGLRELRSLKTYDWKYNGRGGTTKGEPKSGVMATDLKRVMPHAVADVQTGDPTLPVAKAVDYSAVLASTVNAVKTLDRKVARLSSLHKNPR